MKSSLKYRNKTEGNKKIDKYVAGYVHTNLVLKSEYFKPLCFLSPEMFVFLQEHPRHKEKREVSVKTGLHHRSSAVC